MYLILFALFGCTVEGLECSEAQMVSVFVDEDRDGFGDSSRQMLVCEVGPQHATTGGDCDDTRSNVYPGAFEECDGIDNNCDGVVDEGLRVHTWYADIDGDGFGRTSNTVEACSAPPGYVGNDWDCDDDDPLSNPAAHEFCDGKDNDCDDLIDDDDPSTVVESMPTWYKDNDVDGFGTPDEFLKRCLPPHNGAWVQNADDCDDANKAINPNAVEICNEIDDDCDGHIDDSDSDIDPASLTTFWYDGDGDGFGDDSRSVRACKAPWFYTDRGGDCDDDEPNIQDASTGWWVVDADGDGFGDMNAAPQGPGCTPPSSGYVHQAYALDCNDAAAAIFPGAVEICDGLDNNCDGTIDDDDPLLDLSTANTYWLDADGDGFGDIQHPMKACTAHDDVVANADDCDDTNENIHPDATEICNLGIDDDCDGLIDSEDDSLDLSSVLTWYYDFDFDGWGDPLVDIEACEQPAGYVLNDRDCDDNDPTSAYMRPWIQDADGDGFPDGPESGWSCQPPASDWIPADQGTPLDCDDNDPGSYPGAEEICGDGIDQDCDGEDPECQFSDTCADAAVEPPRETGFHAMGGDLASYTNDISLPNGNVCTYFQNTGPEAIVKVRIQPGEILTASLHSDHDMQLYLTSVCNNPANLTNCLAGLDEADWGEPENLIYFNSEGTVKEAYLVADCYSPNDCGQFSLDLDISPAASYYLPENCADAMLEAPLTKGAYAIGGNLITAFVNDMNLGVSNGCTGFSTNGYELFVPVELQPNDEVYLWFIAKTNDGSIYILRDCNNGATCLDGADNCCSGEVEEVWYWNSSFNPEKVYLGLDSFSSTTGPFISRIVIY